MNPGAGGVSLLFLVHLPDVLGPAGLGLVLFVAIATDVGDLLPRVTRFFLVRSDGAVTMSAFAVRIQTAGGQEFPTAFWTRISLA